MKRFALLGGARFDTDRAEFIENLSVVIEDGNIVGLDDVPRNYAGERIDCSGMSIIPGLVNMHDHLTFRASPGPPSSLVSHDAVDQTVRAVRNAHLSLARGITTIRELGARFSINNRVRDAVAQGRLIGPRVFSAGTPLSRTGGHAHYLSLECDGTVGFRAGVREVAKSGADWVKVMASDDPVDGFDPLYTTPDLRPDELNEIVQEARLRGLRTTAHVMGPEAIEWCIDAGFDTLEHGVHLDDRSASRMAEEGMLLVPTISSYRRTIRKDLQRGERWGQLHEPLIDPHTRSVETALRNGVPVAIGTDSVGSFVEECLILNELGLDASECLVAATAGGARILGGKGCFGSIRINALADLAVLRENPLEDIRNLGEVEFTVADGRLLPAQWFGTSLQAADLATGY